MPVIPGNWKKRGPKGNEMGALGIFCEEEKRIGGSFLKRGKEERGWGWGSGMRKRMARGGVFFCPR